MLSFGIFTQLIILMTNPRCTLPNLLKMLRFLGQSSYLIPSRGISWPTELTSKFDEDIDLYLESDGQVRVVQNFGFHSRAERIEASQFLIDRCFWALVEDCVKKLHRVVANSKQNNSGFPHLKQLLYRYHQIQFMAPYDYTFIYPEMFGA